MIYESALIARKYTSHYRSLSVLSFEFCASVVIKALVMRLKNLLPKFNLAHLDIRLELFTILLDRELLIKINRDINLLAAHQLIFRIVELRYIVMSQCLFGGKYLVRVELQEALQKVQRIV